jgi:hypothetical protein
MFAFLFLCKYCVALQISYDDGYSERVLGGVQASYARETVLEIMFSSLQVSLRLQVTVAAALNLAQAGKLLVPPLTYPSLLK